MPNATALIDRQLRLTYSQLDERANQLAHYLRRRGVGAEPMVGLRLTRSAMLVVTVLIHAVIKGSTTINDGSMKVGYTAPSVAGQAEVIASAQRAVGVEPESIAYIEAHGTAAPLGDLNSCPDSYN
jgi:non-ribosomal peptide synthetase component E (peptide arylation enzyme)